ncbi:MAG: hypothetical protein IJR83_07570 [Clostridia bacterium]|nr:hypothetical protein [Clostridia bacterium]
MKQNNSQPVPVAVKTGLGREDIQFYDASCMPFAVYGVKYEKEKGFYRLEQEIAAAVSPDVARLAPVTSGGRIRFSTDSPYVAVRYKVAADSVIPQSSRNGLSGVDLFWDTERASQFVGANYAAFNDLVAEHLFDLPGGGERCYTLNLPIGNHVEYVYIGIKNGSSIGPGKSYRPLDPIVYYGSSITMGGCAGRPGCTYQSIIARHTDVDFINLGFAGAAKGEKAIAEYMRELKMSVFVCDYDHNSPRDELEANHYRMYQTIREKHPDIPYLMVTMPGLDIFNQKEADLRRQTIYSSYLRAKGEGDRHVYFVDGGTFWAGQDSGSCTEDNIHPNDHGFVLMARAIGEVLDRTGVI